MAGMGIRVYFPVAKTLRPFLVSPSAITLLCILLLHSWFGSDEFGVESSAIQTYNEQRSEVFIGDTNIEVDDIYTLFVLYPKLTLRSSNKVGFFNHLSPKRSLFF